jgi:glutamine amidotransferase
MSAPSLTIIDYGLGNLRSVQRAFAHCGISANISTDADEIESAPGVVLPGVGAFAKGMSGLTNAGLIPTIRDYINGGRPFLGICLGMQMLFDSAQEFGQHAGLGIIPGEVRLIPSLSPNGNPHKIPHIGWNSLAQPEENGLVDWSDTILSQVNQGESVYFVHSYAAHPADFRTRLADTWYNGQRIAAAVRKGNVYGCQFHPEKSADVGLRIIKEFGKLCLSTEL